MDFIAVRKKQMHPGSSEIFNVNDWLQKDERRQAGELPKRASAGHVFVSNDRTFIHVD